VRVKETVPGLVTKIAPGPDATKEQVNVTPATVGVTLIATADAAPAAKEYGATVRAPPVVVHVGVTVKASGAAALGVTVIVTGLPKT
jgi:hypothetical protein